MNNRLATPLTDLDQPFSSVANLEDVLASLLHRTHWFLSTRSSIEVAEEYENLGVYVWIDEDQDCFVAHMELSEQGYASVHYPADAACLPFEGTWKLAEIEAVMKSDNWIAAFLVGGVDYFLASFTQGSIH